MSEPESAATHGDYVARRRYWTEQVGTERWLLWVLYWNTAIGILNFLQEHW